MRLLMNFLSAPRTRRRRAPVSLGLGDHEGERVQDHILYLGQQLLGRVLEHETARDYVRAGHDLAGGFSSPIITITTPSFASFILSRSTTSPRRHRLPPPCRL